MDTLNREEGTNAMNAELRTLSQYLTQQQPLGHHPASLKAHREKSRVVRVVSVKNKFSFLTKNGFRGLDNVPNGDTHCKSIRTEQQF